MSGRRGLFCFLGRCAPRDYGAKAVRRLQVWLIKLLVTPSYSCFLFILIFMALPSPPTSLPHSIPASYSCLFFRFFRLLLLLIFLIQLLFLIHSLFCESFPLLSQSLSFSCSFSFLLLLFLHPLHFLVVPSYPFFVHGGITHKESRVL